MRTFFRWLWSPEGIFSRRPRWLKSYIKYIANVLGVGIYELQDWQRALIGEYVGQHKDECLFLLFRIAAELRSLSPTGDPELAYTEYVVQRLFGVEGYVAIVDAVGAFREDAVAVKRAEDRAKAMARAALGNVSGLNELPEYSAAIECGKELAAKSPNFQLDNDTEWAFYGLNVKYFSHLLLTEEFVEWINVQMKGRYAAEMLGRMYKVMDGVASGGLSAKAAKKELVRKFEIK